MVFWMGILAGGLFTWLAVKIGFYEIWVMLFNIIISIYTAIFLRPVIIDVVPSACNTSYGNALVLAVTAVGTFLILFGISFVFLTGEYNISFPKIFDILFAGLLGFLSGFLVLSFAALIITVTPISQNRLIREIGFNRQSQQANISYICWWCDAVNSIVSSPEKKMTSQEAIGQLFDSIQQNDSETLELVEPNEPNDIDTGTIETKPLTSQ